MGLQNVKHFSITCHCISIIKTSGFCVLDGVNYTVAGYADFI